MGSVSLLHGLDCRNAALCCKGVLACFKRVLRNVNIGQRVILLKIDKFGWINYWHTPRKIIAATCLLMLRIGLDCKNPARRRWAELLVGSVYSVGVLPQTHDHRSAIGQGRWCDNSRFCIARYGLDSFQLIVDVMTVQIYI